MLRVYSSMPAANMPTSPVSGVLRQLPLFDGLDPAALARITAGAREFHLRSGTVIFRRGDPCRGFFIVVQGQVKLALHAASGAEKVVELVGSGRCIGASSIARGRPHRLTAETIADTRLVHLTTTSVQEELERTPAFALRVVCSLSDRLDHLITAFEDCMLRSGSERVIRYLTGRLPADSHSGTATITLAVKKGIIASQLNLTQEHFSRILRELASTGMIEVRGRKVCIPDVARLRAQASDAVSAPGSHAKRWALPATVPGSADYGVDRHSDPAIAGFDGGR